MLHFQRKLLRPRRSTLFPYTTLFRSDEEIADSLDGDDRGGHDSERGRRRRRRGRGAEAETGGRNTRDPRRALRRSVSEESDRKSTRLNSSHPSISYAVFCLKKKTDSI